MKKNLFLTGPSGCGKTTILRSVLGDRLSYAGGFITQRALDENNRLLGFDLLPAAAAGGVTGFTAARFLDYTVKPPVSHNEVFRVDAVRLLTEAQMYPYALLDEFGGFELIIPQFREALLDLLNSSLPCIGVLKGAPNAAELRKSLGLGARYTVYRDALENALAHDEDTLLVPVKGHADNYASALVRQWCDAYAL